MATTMEQMQKAMAKAEKAKAKGKITTEKEEPVVARTIEAEVMCGEIIPMPDIKAMIESLPAYAREDLEKLSEFSNKFSGWTAKWISGINKETGDPYKFCRVQFIWRSLEDFTRGIPFVNVYEDKDGNLYVQKIVSEWKDSYTGEKRTNKKNGLKNFFIKGGAGIAEIAAEEVKRLIKVGEIR